MTHNVATIAHNVTTIAHNVATIAHNVANMGPTASKNMARAQVQNNVCPTGSGAQV